MDDSLIDDFLFWDLIERHYKVGAFGLWPLASTETEMGNRLLL